MFSPFERMIAWRYLRSKKAEGFVSVIAGFSFTGILLGVATLIIVMSVMNGFRQELFSRILGINGHMNVYSLSGPLYDHEYYESLIRPIPGVDVVSPIIEGQALLSRRGASTGILVRGLEWKEWVNRPLLKDSVLAGNLDDYAGNNIGIGSVLAKRLQLKPGDEVVLTSPQVKSSPFGTIPRQRRYKIAFVFNVGMQQYNSGFAFMPLESAQTFFGLKGAVNSLEIFIDQPDRLDEMRQAIELAIEGQAGVYDWRDLNSELNNALVVERNVMFLILTMIILVAAFNIISSMIMLVKDKGPDIAIMRTMGATRGNMMKIFMLTGASIGLIGTALGALAGIAFAMNIDTIKNWLESFTEWSLWEAEIRFLSEIPAEIDWSEVWMVIFMALGLTIIATIYPAWRAARLDPVEALRYE